MMFKRASNEVFRFGLGTILGVVVVTGLGCATQDAAASKRQGTRPPAETSTADEAFLQAREAALRDDLARVEQLAPRLAGHPLSPWVDYWRLRIKLADRRLDGNAAVEAEVERQLNRHAGTLTGDLLRRDWIINLGRRAQWQQLDAQYGQWQLRDENQANCWYQLGRVTRGDDPEPARLLLGKVRDFGEGCSALLDAMIRTGGMRREDLWRRMIDALESNSAGTIRRVGRAMGLDPVALDDAIDRPARTLSGRTAREYALIALVRLSRQDLRDAQQRAASAGLNPADRAFVAAQLAASAMRRLDADALSLAREGAQAAEIGDESLTWMARAALRGQDWKTLATVVARMSPELQKDPAWVYWKARAHMAEGRRDDGENLLRTIAGQHHFYGQLAGEELGQLTVAPPRAPAPSAAEVADAERNEGFRRAFAFYALGLRLDGNREWNFQLRTLNDRQLLAAAEFACRRKVLDRCVNTADRTVVEHDFSLRFISPFIEQLRPVAGGYGLDPAWVYGLIRQESRFIMDARSSAGAQGLMQLMPATAKWVARKLGQSDFRVEQLHDLDTNLRFGSFYLRSVYDDLEGSALLASAGYNAGPNRPRTWRSTLPGTVEGAVFAEIIPFTETRDYVKKVLSNATYYSALFTGQPQSLKQRLGQVAPKGVVPSELP